MLAYKDMPKMPEGWGMIINNWGVPMLIVLFLFIIPLGVILFTVVIPYLKGKKDLILKKEEQALNSEKIMASALSSVADNTELQTRALENQTRMYECLVDVKGDITDIKDKVEEIDTRVERIENSDENKEQQ